jgi:hypothetical protein
MLPLLGEPFLTSLSYNRALSKLIFGGDIYQGFNTLVINNRSPAVLEVGMTEANFSNKNLFMGGAILIAAWISHKDMGAMTSLNLASNALGVEGAKVIAGCLPKCT